MPYINFSYKIIVSFIAIFISFYLRAEPFLSPHDPFLRHEIRLLQDEGSLNSTINNWPLNLGGLRSEKNQHSWNHDLLGNTIRKENRSGWTPIRSRIGISDDRVTSRSFGNEPRGLFSTGVETSWMNDRFAAKLSLLALYGVEDDWKGRKDEGLELDGSYIAARLGNWSASLGKVDRWWGPGWDGSLILSTNARPIPAISLDRRISEPFDNKWLSWIGPWSFHTFIGQMEEERHVPNPYLWGIRIDITPTILDGLEVGMFRMMQLGGDGRPEGLSTWVDAFLSQDNTGGNTGKDPAMEPGNQLAGLDLRWRPLDAPFAIYGQVVGEDEDKFLPNALMFQYGLEYWRTMQDSTLRIFVEYADLTSTWWTDDLHTRNVSYGHHIYGDGYRYNGRPVGHWADQDSQVTSIGGFLQRNSGIGWGSVIRLGHLNEDATGSSSVSNGIGSDYFSIEVSNSRFYETYNLSVYSSLGWEKIENFVQSNTNEGITFDLAITRNF